MPSGATPLNNPHPRPSSTTSGAMPPPPSSAFGVRAVFDRRVAFVVVRGIGRLLPSSPPSVVSHPFPPPSAVMPAPGEGVPVVVAVVVVVAAAAVRTTATSATPSSLFCVCFVCYGTLRT
jgi:hypothetical protein